MRNLRIGAATFAFVVMGALAPAMATAQAHQHDAPAPAKTDDKPAAEMMCKKMMEAASAREASLQGLVQQMKVATGDAKVEVMAELLARLVEAPKAPEAPLPATTVTSEKKCEGMKKPAGDAR